MRKNLLFALLFVIKCGFAQLPINCNLFYTLNGTSITNYDPIALTSTPNSISCTGSGLAVSKNLNAALPAVTFYSIIGTQYHYYNGSTWVNTGHSVTNSAAVNLCGAGPYIYNLSGISSQVYRYDGTGTDVLVVTLPGWSGPYDLIGDYDGNFYVLFTTSVSPRLVKYSPTGAILCTYTLIGSPIASAGGGYAIVGNKLFADCSGTQYVGIISGTTITFSPSSLVTGASDFASCPFPQLNSGITSSGSLSCAALTSVLTATTSVTLPTYVWSGPGILSGAGTSAVTVNAAGIYTVVVTGGGGACPGAATSTISVSSSGTAPVATATSPGILTCSTPNLVINGGPTGMTTYAWSGPGVVSGGSTANATVNQPGTYTLSVTNSSGCSSTTTVSVSQNITAPVTTASSSSGSITCSNTTISLTGGPSSGVTYSWSGPSFSGGTSSSSAVATSGGIYTLTTVNTLNGCSNTATVNVPQNTSLPSSIASTSGSVTCLTNTINLTSSPSGMTYAWTAPGGSSIVSGASSQNAIGSGSGTYSVNITNPVNGCSRVAVVSAIVNNTAPAFTASYTGSITCVTNTVNLSSSLAGMNYSWVAPAGSSILSGASSQNAIGQGSGIYSITCTNPINGCFTLHTVNVTASSALPTLTVAATSNTITCAAPTITLTASSSNTNAIIWSIGTTTLSNPLLVNAAGEYVATITDLITGCVNTRSISITGGTVIPTVSTASNAVIPCGIATVSLTATSTLTTDIVYNWTGPTILSGSNSQTPVVGQVGIYTVVTTNTITGCNSTATVNVTQGTITAAFNADPITGGAPLNVNFTDMSTGALTYSWTFDNGNTSTVINPSTNYPSTGSYNVMLIITNGVCIDTAIVTIVVEDGFSLEIPNVFTPNDDGSNDIFTIKSTGVKEITLQLFNRWGEKLYEFTGPKAGWDGINANGSKASDGSYFYFIKATGYDGKEVEKQGTFNLFR